MTRSRLDSFFGVTQAGSTLRLEALAGATTFLAMAYIVFVNPAVLSQTGMDFGAVFTATCLASAIATLIMALVANYPIALAPGMGQNFFFVAAVAGMGLTWQQALAAVFLAGVAFIALTLSRARTLIIASIPESLKAAIAAGIGLLIAFIGLAGAGIVQPNPGGLLRLGALRTAPVALCVVGLVLTVALAARGIGGALLAGIGAATALALGLGLAEFHGMISAPPSLAPTFMQLDLPGALTVGALPAVLVFFYMALFDAIGTLVAVGQQAGLMKEGRLVRGERALAADACGTVVGSCLGTSTVTAYVESAAGVQAGARTGLAGLVTAGLFLMTLIFSPLVKMVGDGPAARAITAPALILVGSLMARSLTRVAWDDLTEALPAFLVLIGIPLSFSIGDGIALGVIAYPVVKVLAGRWREAPWLMYVLAAAFLARYLLIA